MRNIKRRAWNGGLKNIDELMAWMYDKDILNKTDKNKKDSIFRQYYRFYNDGDAPRGVLRKYGVSMYDRDAVETKLEEYLNEYISAMLKKYCKKVNRKLFYVDRKLSKLNTVLRVTEEFEVHGLVTYWKKDIENATIVSFIENFLEVRYNDLRTKLTAKFPEDANRSFSYIFRTHKVTPELEAEWLEIKKIMLGIAMDLKVEKAKLEMKRALIEL